MYPRSGYFLVNYYFYEYVYHIIFTDLEKSILFEVSCMDIDHLCVTFEMSQHGGMASFELDFTDLRNVQSKMHKMSSSTPDALTDVVAKAVFDR